LQNLDNYSLQKPVRRNYKRSRISTSSEFEEYDADLADVTSLSQQNDGIQFLLIVIDLFSRHLHVRPLKNKSSKTVLEAFQDIFNNTIKPKKLRERSSAIIYHHIARNQTKANYAERCIKTLKGMLYRYFTKKRTYRYIDVLQKFASAYNATPHRSLNYIAPQDVNDDNQSDLWVYMYLKSSLKIRIQSKPSKIKIEATFSIQNW
jgi:hypothetical protein